MNEGAYFLNMVFWSRFSALATVVTGVVLFVTLILIWCQQKAYGKTQELQGFVQVVNWLQNEEVRRARRRVYELKIINIKGWTEKDKWLAEIVCHNFDVVGDMLDKKLITKRVLENWALTIKRCWEVVGPLVEQYREERPHPGLWKNFQQLAEETFEPGKRKV